MFQQYFWNRSIWHNARRPKYWSYVGSSWFTVLWQKKKKTLEQSHLNTTVEHSSQPHTQGYKASQILSIPCNLCKAMTKKQTHAHALCVSAPGSKWVVGSSQGYPVIREFVMKVHRLVRMKQYRFCLFDAFIMPVMWPLCLGLSLRSLISFADSLHASMYFLFRLIICSWQSEIYIYIYV